MKAAAAAAAAAVEGLAAAVEALAVAAVMSRLRSIAADPLRVSIRMG